MHLGLVMACDYRYGTTREEAFEEAFTLMEAAETGGLDDVWLSCGSPDMVVEKRQYLQDTLGLAGIVIAANVGGGIPRELVLQSVRLIAQEVAPRLRE